MEEYSDSQLEIFEQGKLASRKALRNLLNNHHYPKSADMEIDRHYCLKYSPCTLVSVSHSLQWGAAVIANRPTILSVGIDIEKSSRQIRQGTYKYFINEQDDQSLSPLEIWIRKEACFKSFHPLRHLFGALNSSKPKTWTLNDLWICGTHFGIKNNKFSLGEVFSFHYEDISGAYAIIK